MPDKAAGNLCVQSGAAAHGLFARYRPAAPVDLRFEQDFISIATTLRPASAGKLCQCWQPSIALVLCRKCRRPSVLCRAHRPSEPFPPALSLLSPVISEHLRRAPRHLCHFSAGSARGAPVLNHSRAHNCCRKRWPRGRATTVAYCSCPPCPAAYVSPGPCSCCCADCCCPRRNLATAPPIPLGWTCPCPDRCFQSLQSMFWR